MDRTKQPGVLLAMTLNIEGNSIKIPFAIGQKVWHAKSSQEPEYITCPDCLGEKVLTVLQGNGLKFTIECAACRVSYDPPTGRVKTRLYKVYPQAFTCHLINIVHNTFYYYDEHKNSAESDRLFTTLEECQKKCDELNKKHAEEQDRILMASLQSRRRDLAWSVHYWSRQVKDLERQLELAKARLNVCKEKKNDQYTN